MKIKPISNTYTFVYIAWNKFHSQENYTHFSRCSFRRKSSVKTAEFKIRLKPENQQRNKVSYYIERAARININETQYGLPPKYKIHKHTTIYHTTMEPVNYKTQNMTNVLSLTAICIECTRQGKARHGNARHGTQ